MLSWSILQYFRPSFSYHLSLSLLFCLLLSGRLRQVLLYHNELNSDRKTRTKYVNKALNN